MKRGSVVGPLVLIAIGFMFLMKNIRPDLPLFNMFMDYWPFLLIAWGVLRLLEILVIYFRGGKLPVSGVSGGEWALVIVLAIVGSSVWGVHRFSRDGFGKIRVGGVEVFGESYDYPVELSNIKASKTARIVIDNPRGNTRVVGADIEEVRVNGRKSVRAMGKDEADKANTQSKVQMSAAGEVVTIYGNQDRADGPRVSTDLEISVPRGASIETRGRYGDVEISDVNGEININSDNAGVRLQNLGGRVRIDTRKSDILRATGVKGDVELKGRGRDIELEDIAGTVLINGAYSGETSLRKLAKGVRFESAVTEFRVERIPGELQLSLSALTGHNLIGPVMVKAKSKDVRFTDVTESINLDIDRGDVELRPGKTTPKIDVKISSGDIELGLPPQSKFTLNATTRRGEITNDFDPRLKEDKENNGGTLAGTLGAGPEIKLSTNRGSLTLVKAIPGEVVAEAPEPKAPKPPKVVVPAAPPRADNQ